MCRDDCVGEVGWDESQVQCVAYTLGRGDIDVGIIVIAEGYYFQLLDRWPYRTLSLCDESFVAGETRLRKEEVRVSFGEGGGK